MANLVVFTRDLRTTDNPTLSAAGESAVPVFVSDPEVASLHGSLNRQAFLAESLRDLDRSLSEMGAPLVHRVGPWVTTVCELVQSTDADSVHVARDVSGFSTRRITALRDAVDVPVVLHDGITAHPPDAFAPAGGSFYQVFTPYHRKWSAARLSDESPRPTTLDAHGIERDPLPETPDDGTSALREEGGETIARQTLADWLAHATNYDETRNALAADGTSRLSAALHFGTISAREVVEASLAAGASDFARQIAWRDFNHQVLYHRPDASTDDYRPVSHEWADDPDSFAAWCRGRTGYPVIDAAMRQLKQTGWMHNRARMLTASFLTKDLMLDWRLGARWFMTWLTDGDVANNQLGWQWVAGSGTDTNPHRIFNPTLQSQRYDPSGDYIRRWVQELADVSDEEIHDPGPLLRSAVGYPDPIVDHHEAIRFYRSARVAG